MDERTENTMHCFAHVIAQELMRAKIAEANGINLNNRHKEIERIKLAVTFSDDDIEYFFLDCKYEPSGDVKSIAVPKLDMKNKVEEIENA